VLKLIKLLKVFKQFTRERFVKTFHHFVFSFNSIPSNGSAIYRAVDVAHTLVSFGMKYSQMLVSPVVKCGRQSGTCDMYLKTSSIVASIRSMFCLSLIVGSRSRPMTVSMRSLSLV